MFKRRLRIVFVQEHDQGLSRAAAGYAAAAHDDWLAPQAACVQDPGPALSDPLTAAVNELGIALADEAVPWDAGAEPAPDLVITLGEAAWDALPALPAGTQHRHWPLAGHDRATLAELVERVDGVVGGLRLLARVDDPGKV